MNKKPILQRIGDFMAGKGFYIVLFLCVAAIGISGYYLFSNMGLGEPEGQPVGGNIQVEVTPTIRPTAPTVPPTPRPTPTPAATPAPTVTPAPTATVKPTIFTWPVKGETIADFSLEVLAYDTTMGDWRTHSGMDIAAALGTQVLAVSDGTVESIVQDDLMGTVVTIAHNDGLKSIYANLAEVPTVEVGDAVETGAVVGAVGDTAVAESGRASHLHFEMEENGQAVDPANYLPEQQ